MTRATVILNPLSGRGRHQHQLHAHGTLARECLAELGVEAVVRETTGAGDAQRFARDAVADRADLVVVWGGDGTVNEAASALTGTRVPLGIVPAGSGNGLATDLGLPVDPVRALRIAVTGRDFAIDAGQVHDSLFFNIAGIGVDAVIAARFAERGMRKRGPLGYLQLSFSELVRYRAQTYTFSIDNQRSEQRAMLVAVANGRQYGNNVCIAPGAKLDDGLLELVIVEPLSMVSIAARLPSLFRGTLRAGRGVTMRAVRSLHLSAPGPIPFHVDGEPRLGPSAIEIAVRPRSLVVRAP